MVFSWIYGIIGHMMELSSSVWNGALDILKQPIAHKSLLLSIIPLIITLLLIEIYFSRYKREDAGWNSAFGNSIVLILVGANLMYDIIKDKIIVFANSETTSWLKTIIVLIVIIEGLALLIVNFFHMPSKNVALKMSSVPLLNFIAMISVILISSDVKIDTITLIASCLMFAVLSLFLRTLRIAIPEQIFEEVKEIENGIKNGKIALKEAKAARLQKEKEDLIKKEEELKREEEKIQKIKQEILKGKKDIEDVRLLQLED